ncbi:hypothetical protein [Halopiger goleimassiliensis]|uniref:hypothetical protein n=1 Tax=Halopiger goleimassiliensis TaxID=1293048 RepID=UPI000677CDC2|nr:hypothetical protein [Halopiger goleimassiliensis]
MALSKLLSGLRGPADSSDSEGRSESEDDRTVVRECRNCGTNVSAGTTRCPVCDAADIAVYSID